MTLTVVAESEVRSSSVYG